MNSKISVARIILCKISFVHCACFEVPNPINIARNRILP
jgi:hypothetical protein